MTEPIDVTKLTPEEIADALEELRTIVGWVEDEIGAPSAAGRGLALATMAGRMLAQATTAIGMHVRTSETVQPGEVLLTDGTVKGTGKITEVEDIAPNDTEPTP